MKVFKPKQGSKSPPVPPRQGDDEVSVGAHSNLSLVSGLRLISYLAIVFDRRPDLKRQVVSELRKMGVEL